MSTTTHVIYRTKDGTFRHMEVEYDDMGKPKIDTLLFDKDKEVIITINDNWDFVRGFLNAANSPSIHEMRRGDPPF